MTDCSDYNIDIQTHLKQYGDYNCDGELNITDVMDLVQDIVNNVVTPAEYNINDVMNIVTKIMQQSQQEHRNALQQIISSESTTTPLSPVTQDTTQDLNQVTRQQAQEELDTAAESDPDIGINKLAIINVPRTPGTTADGYDIFFKGPEVLEYLVTFGNNVDSTIKTLANQSLFHNLFTTTNPLYNSEQAFRTDGNKVYQARRSNTHNLSTTPWSTNLIHMFTSQYRITSLTKIQFQDETLDSNAVTILSP